MFEKLSCRVEREWNLPMAATLLFLHIFGAYAFWHGMLHGFSFLNWILFVTLGYGISGLGVTLGYHRMYVHGGFKTRKRWLKYMLCYGAGVGGQRGKTWIEHHFWHHFYEDTKYDPHSPYYPFNGGIKGFWWAHMGWLCFKYQSPNEGEKPYQRACRDEAVEWEHRNHPWIVASGFAIPFVVMGTVQVWFGSPDTVFYYRFLAGAWDGLLLEVLRFLFVLHMVWLVNSAGHMCAKGLAGRKSRSANNPFIAVFGVIGEWFHANHHDDPHSAFLGWHWWQLDLGKWVIIVLERLGTVYDVHRPRMGS